MTRVLAGLLRRLAPRTMEGLRDLAVARERHGSVAESLDRLQPSEAIPPSEIAASLMELRHEVDELRINERHVAELYDLVMQRIAAQKVD